jgi:hypothetical protein
MKRLALAWCQPLSLYGSQPSASIFRHSFAHTGGIGIGVFGIGIGIGIGIGGRILRSEKTARVPRGFFS